VFDTIESFKTEVVIPFRKMTLPRLCTLLSVFLLCKLPSIHVGAVKQPVRSRELKGGIIDSVEEAWGDTARVSKGSVETRCIKPARRLMGSKSGKGKNGGYAGYTGNSLKEPGSSKQMKSKKGSVPLCDDLSPNRVTSAPAPGPTSQDIPTNSSPTPVDNNLDCTAIAAGIAPTDAPSKSFTITANLIVDGSVPNLTILSQLGEILQREVAPALAGCAPNDRRRVLQELGIVNVLFGTPGAIQDGK
jgi:hypothetical protein